MKVVDFEPGTFVKQFLAGLGVTEDRYKEFKAAVGLPPNCSCAARAKWMNDAWKWVAAQGYRSLPVAVLPKRDGVDEYRDVRQAVKRKCRRGVPRTHEENLARIEALQRGEL